MVHDISIQVADHKVEGPVTILVFLGIDLDTTDMIMHLPEEKLQLKTSTIREWLNRKAAKKREIPSIVDELVHATKIVSEGRIIIRRTIDTAHS